MVIKEPLRQRVVPVTSFCDGENKRRDWEKVTLCECADCAIDGAIVRSVTQGDTLCVCKLSDKENMYLMAVCQTRASIEHTHRTCFSPLFALFYKKG